MKCILYSFKTYCKLEVKSIIILLDMPSHTDLMPEEQTYEKNFKLLPRTEIVELFTSLNNKVKQHVLSKEASHLKHKFSLLHLNIRSPQFNGNKFTDLFERPNFTFSVIVISETWFDESSQSVEIDGFDFIRKPRANIASGGVGLFISNDLKFKLGNNLQFYIDVPEYQFIEIIRPGEKKPLLWV